MPPTSLFNLFIIFFLGGKVNQFPPTSIQYYIITTQLSSDNFIKLGDHNVVKSMQNCLRYVRDCAHVKSQQETCNCDLKTNYSVKCVMHSLPKMKFT